MKTISGFMLSALISMLTTSTAHASVFDAAGSAADFGAIAYSPSLDRVTAFANAASNEEAVMHALKKCAAPDCTIVVSGQNEWLALASGENGAVGVSHGHNRDTAMQSAFRRCQQQSSHCRWRASVASQGRPQDQIILAGAGPQAPSLAALGGPYSKTIPNFVGYQQQHANWCWAAITQTIYHMMTGAKLSQGLLARIQLIEDPENPNPPLSERKHVITAISCTGDATDPAECDHGGNAPIALSVVGASLPFSNYPAMNNSLVIYRLLRESLDKNVPLGISVKWYDGGNHSIVVYGADFLPNDTNDTHENSSNNGLEPAVIRLRIFDPFDGRLYQMSSNVYHPRYEEIPGQFEGVLTVANIISPDVHRVSNAACQFMIESEKEKFCRADSRR